jgi:hypothetical protein
MKACRGWPIAFLAASLFMSVSSGSQTVQSTPSQVPATAAPDAPVPKSISADCVLSSGKLRTASLEGNQAAVKGAGSLANQMILTYEADPTKQPDLSSQYGLLNSAVLQAMLCGEAPQTATSTLTAEGATAQTNKQLGAPPASNGSTSAVQKLGVPQLLGIAIENGGITNNITGNTMTLNTSAYGLVAGFTQDTQSAYANCPFCVQLGASATFNLTNTSDPLQNASRKQVSQWQLKYTFRDTSIRSHSVVPIYEQSNGLGPAASNLAKDLSSSAYASGGVMSRLNEDLGSVLKNADVWKSLEDVIKQQMPKPSGSGSTDNGQTTGTSSSSATTTGTAVVATKILQYLDNDAAYQKDLQDAAADPGVRDLISRYTADLKAYLSAHTVFEAKVKNLQQGFNGDLTFGEQFPTTGNTSNKSSTTTPMPAYLVGGLDLSWQPHTAVPNDDNMASLEINPKPSLTANFGASVYTNPNAMLNEGAFRGGTAALQAQWGLGRGPFVKNVTDKSELTVSLSGKYQRLQENSGVAGKKADIALGNIKIEIPISSGVSFPLSVTFANSSEQIKESYVRGNFGISFDLDKLASLLNAK